MASSLPHVAMASSLPHVATANFLPRVTMASFLPRVVMASSLPRVATASSLPHVAVVSSLPLVAINRGGSHCTRKQRQKPLHGRKTAAVNLGVQGGESQTPLGNDGRRKIFLSTNPLH